MQPLLRIQNIPISISFSSKRAQLRQNSQQPRYELTRTRGRSDIRTEPARIKIDSYEMRASMGLKSPTRSVQEFAQTGRTAAVEAAANYAENGNQIMAAKDKRQAMSDIAMSKVLSTCETIMTFSPSVKPEMWVEGGTISFDYTMDQLDFNWQIKPRPDMDFVPGSVDFEVLQYPEVRIEYLGSPIYVPPSADPNYEPPLELNASA